MKKSVLLMAGLLAMALAGSAQAATMFAVQDAGANDKMVVTDGGFIGVGNAVPTKNIQVTGATAAQTQLLLNVLGTTTTGGGGILLYHNNAANALPNANDRLGYFLFGGFDGTTGRNGAGIAAKAEETWAAGGAGVGRNGTYFAFETTPNGTSGSRVERMRIAADGNVGIGTTGTPTSKLQVVGLPPYANNAAALAGGLTAGAFYRTGADPDVVCVVH